MSWSGRFTRSSDGVGQAGSRRSAGTVPVVLVRYETFEHHRSTTRASGAGRSGACPGSGGRANQLLLPAPRRVERCQCWRVRSGSGRRTGRRVRRWSRRAWRLVEDTTVPDELDLLPGAGDPHRCGLHPASISTPTRSGVPGRSRRGRADKGPGRAARRCCRDGTSIDSGRAPAYYPDNPNEWHHQRGALSH